MVATRKLIDIGVCNRTTICIGSKGQFRACSHHVVLGRDCSSILAAGKVQSGQGAYPARGDGSRTGTRTGQVRGGVPTHIHPLLLCAVPRRVTIPAGTAGRLSRSSAWCIPALPRVVFSHTLADSNCEFQIGAMEEATSGAIDAELRELNFG